MRLKMTVVASVLMFATAAALVTAAQSGPAVSATATGAVTFAKDVAPILQEKCQACHQVGSIAPMPLVTYDDARKVARSIKNKVSARLMPPWHIDKNIGIREFQNDRSLSDAADRHHRPLGRRRIADGRSEGHAAAEDRIRIPRGGSSPRDTARRIS